MTEAEHLNTTAAWPSALRSYLNDHNGAPTTLRRLYGLSHNKVWEAAFPAARFVIKATENPVEPYAYQYLAPFLGDAIPRLEWSHTEAAEHWLVLEYIPNPLPRERWLADPAVLEILHRLHQIELPLAEQRLFRPGWSDETTARVLGSFLADRRPLLETQLHRLQQAAQPLFQPVCAISGDPNPRNWGVRDDGTLVLFDLERLGHGAPGLDLAITVPGLGDQTAFTTVAEGYLRYSDRPNVPSQLQQLTREIALAKTWSVIEFLDHVAIGRAADTGMLPALLERLPPWIAQIIEWTA
jgi:hypothetical protein